MDETFPLVGMQRQEVVVELDYHSVSEDELVQEQYFLTQRERE